MIVVSVLVAALRLALQRDRAQLWWMDIEHTEDEAFSFAFAVSDETLEAAGNADRLAIFSLGNCTEARVCPAPS